MMLAILKLRFSPQSLREARAWYIPGSDAAIWLEEIADWQVSHSDIRLYPIPRSRSDRNPIGVLAVCGAGEEFRPAARCIPYGRISGRLFLPVEAVLDPDVSEVELETLLLPGLVYVWSPISGCAAFEPDEILTAGDLLDIAPPKECLWDCAQPGAAISKRLVSLLPREELTLELIFQQGQDDIGTRQNEINELPPSPQEGTQGIAGEASRRASRALAGIVRWFTQRVPAGSGEPTWINRLENWAEKRLADVRQNLEAARNKEISRLMHLLETDPDRGLRFALPMSGEAHRGLAPPGVRLGERNIEFSLSGGGSGAADFWSIDNHYRHQLIARYRELANREIRLGRHRRAAYIFAELLGDFDSAANVLVSGRYWREAAILYHKRLNRPQQAARCYEQGGLWAEAIELYEELEEFEKAGDLHAALNQPESAREQYRKAVEQHRLRRDYLAAAGLLQAKLNEPDESLQTLRLGWPHSQQAEQCLREMFRLQGELGRHDASLDLVREFRVRPQSLALDAAVAEILADQAAGYPDRNIQQNAADCTRAVVSRHLALVTQSDARRLLAAVSRLVPEDRLLSRDCQRYLHRLPAKKPSPTAGLRIPRKQGPKVLRTITLPQGYDWKQAAACGRTIYAAGIRDLELTLVRCCWEGHISAPLKPWKLEPGQFASPMILSAAPLADRQLLVHVVGNSPFPERRFTPSDQISEEMAAGGVRGMSGRVIGAARAGHGATWLLEPQDGQFTLIAIGHLGETTQTMTLPYIDIASGFSRLLPIPMHARGDTVFIGLHNTLLIETGGGEPETIEFDGQIQSLAGSAPNSRTRIAVTFDRGGKIYWHGMEGSHIEPFGGEMENPVACINRGGYLIAASQAACEIYATHDRRLTFEAEIKNIGFQPIAVLSSPRIHEFGLLSDKGVITVYEIT